MDSRVVLASAASRAGGDEVATTAPHPPQTFQATVPGLVVTGQNGTIEPPGVGLADVLGVRFPRLADVKAAAAALQDASRETPLRSLIEVSPGSIRFRRTVPADDELELPDKQNGTGRKAITSWTLKSRRQMLRSFAALDYMPVYAEGGIPARVTLTYPGDWLVVAPDGDAVTAHFKTLERRFVRAWGEPLLCLWKLEFQRRGAPHIHMWMRRPNGVARAGRCAVGQRFTRWLSVNWADIVAHPDPVERAAHERVGTQVDVKGALKVTDPKRASVYFSKHGVWKGSKEYQNQVPAEWRESGKGPGRFWGYRGLRPIVVSAQVDGGKDYQLAKRTMRRWSARTRIWDAEAKSVRYVKPTKPVRVQRGNRVRTVRRPVTRLGGKSGTLCLNDGPAVAAELARFIAMTVEWDRQDAAAARPRSRPVSSYVDALSAEPFLCPSCGRTHPLREHKVCRARARTVVRLR